MSIRIECATLKNGKKDDLDKISGLLMKDRERYSLSHLLSCCPDFIYQQSDLEELASELSVLGNNVGSVLFTPKFHCELAGEGIEYSWGMSKRMYRKKPIAEKRSVANFERLVTLSLSQVSIDSCRRFSSRARKYMLTYSHKYLKGKAVNAGDVEDEAKKMEWSLELNEKIRKQYSSHRDVNIIDGKFLQTVILESIGVKHECDEV